MCCFAVSDYCEIQENVNDAQEIDESTMSLEDIPEWLFLEDKQDEIPNPLDKGTEIDLDNDTGLDGPGGEEDMEIDSILQGLSALPHKYCNLPQCNDHGPFFTSYHDL